MEAILQVDWHKTGIVDAAINGDVKVQQSITRCRQSELKDPVTANIVFQIIAKHKTADGKATRNESTTVQLHVCQQVNLVRRFGFLLASTSANELLVNIDFGEMANDSTTTSLQQSTTTKEVIERQQPTYGYGVRRFDCIATKVHCAGAADRRVVARSES